MAIAYNPLLVLLSIAIAVQASYVALRLTIQVTGSRGVQRRLLLIGASLSLAMGIWGMHFIGMLAARLPAAVNYQVLPTLTSFLVCVLVVGFAIVAASHWPRTPATLAVTAAVMGIGIATMHYVGMMALHDSLHMVHEPAYVVASILSAIATSAAALWLAIMARRRPPLIVCAVVLGLAISSMHYIAMMGTRVHPLSLPGPETSPSLSTELMAIVVAVVAFIISAGFCLTLVPEPDSERPVTSGEQAATPAGASQADFAPGELAAGAEAPCSEPRRRSPRPLPVERDGSKSLIAPEDVYAVRANAHYTYVFNGREDLFCSLSIGDVEEQLVGGPFARVHRSHIVNLDHILDVRKTPDGGFAELAGLRRICVPISRSKVGEFKVLVAGRSPVSAPQPHAS